MIKKIISSLVLIAFLTTNLGFAAEEIGNLHLAPALRFGSLGDQHHKDIVIAKMALTGELELLDKTIDIDKASDINTIRAAFAKREEFSTASSKQKKLSTIYQKPEDGVRVFFESVEHVGGNIFSVPIAVTRTGVRRDYRLLFSTLRNPQEAFPTGICTAEELEAMRQAIAAANSIPLRQERDAQAMARYETDNEKIIDRWIDERIRNNEFAEINGRAQALGLDDLVKYPGRVKPSDLLPGDFMRELEWGVEAFSRYCGLSVTRGPLAGRNIVFLKVPRGSKPPVIHEKDASGADVPVAVMSHSSNGALYVMLDEDVYARLLTADLRERTSIGLAYIFPRLVHEMGVIYGLSYYIRDGRIENDFDILYSAYKFSQDRPNKNFVQNVRRSHPALMRTLSPVDLDSNLVTRDYAWGVPAFGMKSVVNYIHKDSAMSVERLKTLIGIYADEERQRTARKERSLKPEEEDALTALGRILEYPGLKKAVGREGWLYDISALGGVETLKAALAAKRSVGYFTEEADKPWMRLSSRRVTMVLKDADEKDLKPMALVEDDVKAALESEFGKDELKRGFFRPGGSRLLLWCLRDAGALSCEKTKSRTTKINFYAANQLKTYLYYIPCENNSVLETTSGTRYYAILDMRYDEPRVTVVKHAELADIRALHAFAGGGARRSGRDTAAIRRYLGHQRRIDVPTKRAVDNGASVTVRVDESKELGELRIRLLRIFEIFAPGNLVKLSAAIPDRVDFINMGAGLDWPRDTVAAADYEEHDIAVRAHISKRFGMHIYLTGGEFHDLFNLANRVPPKALTGEIRRWFVHEVGVALGLPVLRFVNGRPVNELDDAYREYTEYGKLNDIDAYKGLIAALNRAEPAVNLDSNLVTRDYAAGSARAGAAARAQERELRAISTYIRKVEDSLAGARILDRDAVLCPWNSDYILVKVGFERGGLHNEKRVLFRLDLPEGKDTVYSNEEHRAAFVAGAEFDNRTKSLVYRTHIGPGRGGVVDIHIMPIPAGEKPLFVYRLSSIVKEEKSKNNERVAFASKKPKAANLDSKVGTAEVPASGIRKIKIAGKEVSPELFRAELDKFRQEHKRREKDGIFNVLIVGDTIEFGFMVRETLPDLVVHADIKQPEYGPKAFGGTLPCDDSHILFHPFVNVLSMAGNELLNKYMSDYIVLSRFLIECGIPANRRLDKDGLTSGIFNDCLFYRYGIRKFQKLSMLSDLARIESIEGRRLCAPAGKPGAANAKPEAANLGDRRGSGAGNGVNPDVVWRAICGSDAVTEALEDNGYFTAADCREGLDEMAQALGLSGELSDKAVIDALGGLLDIYKGKPGKDYLAFERYGTVNRYRLTPGGIEERDRAARNAQAVPPVPGAVIPSGGGKLARRAQEDGEALTPLQAAGSDLMLPSKLAGLMTSAMRAGSAGLTSAVMTDDGPGGLVERLLKSKVYNDGNDLRTTLRHIESGLSGDPETIRRTVELANLAHATDPGSPIPMAIAHARMEDTLDPEAAMKLASRVIHNTDPELERNLSNLARGNADEQIVSFDWLFGRMITESERGIRSGSRSSQFLAAPALILKHVNGIISNPDISKWSALRAHIIMRFAERLSAEARSEEQPVIAFLHWAYPRESKDFYLAVDSLFTAVSEAMTGKEGEKLIEKYGGYEKIAQGCGSILSMACYLQAGDFFEYLRTRYKHVSPNVKAFYLSAMRFGIAVPQKAADGSFERVIVPKRLEFLLVNVTDLAGNDSPIIQRRCREVVGDLFDAFTAYLKEPGDYTKLDDAHRKNILEMLLESAAYGPDLKRRRDILPFVMFELNKGFEENSNNHSRILLSDYFSDAFVRSLTPEEGLVIRTRIVEGFRVLKSNGVVAKNCVRILACYGMASIEECYEYYRQRLALDYTLATDVLRLAAKVASVYEAKDASERLKMKTMVLKLAFHAAEAAALKADSVKQYDEVAAWIAVTTKELENIRVQAETATVSNQAVTAQLGQLDNELDQSDKELADLRKYLAVYREGVDAAERDAQDALGEINAWQVLSSAARALLRFFIPWKRAAKPAVSKHEAEDDIDRWMGGIEEEKKPDRNVKLGVFQQWLRRRFASMRLVFTLDGREELKKTIGSVLAKQKQVRKQRDEVVKKQVAIAHDYNTYAKRREDLTKLLKQVEEKLKEEKKTQVRDSFRAAKDMFDVLAQFVFGPTTDEALGRSALDIACRKSDGEAALLALAMSRDPRFAGVSPFEKARAKVISLLAAQAERGIYEDELAREIEALASMVKGGAMAPASPDDEFLAAVVRDMTRRMFAEERGAAFARLGEELATAQARREKRCKEAIESFRRSAGVGDALIRTVYDYLKSALMPKEGVNDPVAARKETVDPLMNMFVYIMYNASEDDAVKFIFSRLSGENGAFFVRPSGKKITKPENRGEVFEKWYGEYYEASSHLRASMASISAEMLKAEEGIGWGRRANGIALGYLAEVFNSEKTGPELKGNVESLLVKTVFAPWIKEWRKPADPQKKAKRFNFDAPPVLDTILKYVSAAPALSQQMVGGKAGYVTTDLLTSVVYIFAQRIQEISITLDKDETARASAILEKAEAVFPQGITVGDSDAEEVSVLIAVREALVKVRARLKVFERSAAAREDELKRLRGRPNVAMPPLAGIRQTVRLMNGRPPRELPASGADLSRARAGRDSPANAKPEAANLAAPLESRPEPGRRANIDISEGSTTTAIEKMIEGAWQAAGDSIRNVAEPKAEAALKEIARIEKHRARYRVPASPVAYHRICYARLFYEHDYKAVIRFFESLQAQRASTPLAYSAVFSNPDFMALYFMARMLDRDSVREAAAAGDNFFLHYAARISGKRDYSVLAGMRMTATERVMAIEGVIIAAIKSYAAKGDREKALEMLDSLSAIVASDLEKFRRQSSAAAADIVEGLERDINSLLELRYGIGGHRGAPAAAPSTAPAKPEAANIRTEGAYSVERIAYSGKEATARQGPMTFEEIRKRFMWMSLISFGGVNHFNMAKGLNYTVEDLATDPDKQSEVIGFIQDTLRLDAVFTMMDLSSWPEAVYEANKSVGALPVRSVFTPTHVDQVGALFGEGFEFNKENIAKLKVPDPYRDGRTGVFLKTMSMLKARYGDTVAKIGYVEAPFTLATRLRNNGVEVTVDVKQDWDTFEALLDYCTKVSISQVEALAGAGADAAVILDPQTALIELIGPAAVYYRKCIVEAVNKVADAAHRKGIGVIFHGCGDSTPYLGYMPEIRADAFSIDEAVDMDSAYGVLTKDGRFLIGNIKASQMALKTPEVLKEEVLSLMRRFGMRENFIAGITCEMPFNATMDQIMAITRGMTEYQMSVLEQPVDVGAPAPAPVSGSLAGDAKPEAANLEEETGVKMRPYTQDHADSEARAPDEEMMANERVKVVQTVVDRTLLRMPRREARVLSLRARGLTLETIANMPEFDVSRPLIWQVEKKGARKLWTMVGNELAKSGEPCIDAETLTLLKNHKKEARNVTYHFVASAAQETAKPEAADLIAPAPAEPVARYAAHDTADLTHGADLLAEARAALPAEWRENGLDFTEFAWSLVGLTGQPLRLDRKSAMIFSERVTFDGGLGILLPKLARSGRRIAVVTSSGKRRALIEELNAGLPEDARIVAVASVIDAKSAVPAAHYTYFKVKGDPDAGDLSWVTTCDITDLVERIIRMLGRVTGIGESTEAASELYRATRKFIEVAA